MAEKKEIEAFDTLLELADVGRIHAKGLPSQIDIKPYWTGVGFSLFGNRYVAPMGEVTEMLEVPSYTHLPGVKTWVKGVSNVRGRLLPLTDLAAFFDGNTSASSRRQRVLVVEVGEIYSGLVVDAVFGMQHFPVENYSQTVSVGLANEAISSFLQGTFVNDEGEGWAVLSPWALARDEKFFQATMEL